MDIKKVDFNNISQIIREAKSLQFAIRYWEQKKDAYKINDCKERLNKIENLILKCDNPFFAYVFARDVEVSDIKAFETIIKKSAWKILWRTGTIFGKINFKRLKQSASFGIFYW